MHQYQELLSDVLRNGEQRPDRTGTGTLSVFGRQVRFDLQAGFPIVTCKRVHFKSVVGELLWFLSGNTNAHELRDKYGVTIWDEFADNKGNLGPIYSSQWSSWRTHQGTKVNQLTTLLRDLRERPHSRRHIVSAWNVADLPDETLRPYENPPRGKMSLPPCHVLFQFYVSTSGKLSCQLYQRSADLFLGVPFNIASYALLTHMVAQVCGYEVGEFIHTFGDLHLYQNHIEQAELALSRHPKPLPKLALNPNVHDLHAFTVADILLEEYEHHPHIAAEVAV